MFISNDCLDPPFSLPTQATWLKPLHQTLPMLAPDHVFRKVYRTIGGFQSLSTSIRSSCSQASLVLLILCKVFGDSSDFNSFLAVRVAKSWVSALLLSAWWSTISVPWTMGGPEAKLKNSWLKNSRLRRNKVTCRLNISSFLPKAKGI